METLESIANLSAYGIDTDRVHELKFILEEHNSPILPKAILPPTTILDILLDLDCNGYTTRCTEELVVDNAASDVYTQLTSDLQMLVNNDFISEAPITLRLNGHIVIGMAKVDQVTSNQGRQ